MLNVNENNIFRIKGKFPTKGVKYFSLQSNNPEVRKKAVRPAPPIDPINPPIQQSTSRRAQLTPHATPIHRWASP